MEMNLFSSFDPNCGFLFFSNYFIIALILGFPKMYWYSFSRYSYCILFLVIYLNKELSILVSKKIFGGLMMYVCLFMFILQFNIFGMFPYIFSMTSQLVMNLFFSFIFFFIFYLVGWANMSKNMLAHLTPLGSPLPLAPFLVYIELISSVIRPFTLAIRLTANIVSGHIMMEIILAPSENFSLIISIIYFCFVLPVLFLELMVCFVQAYVISSLSGLYLGEPLSH